MTETPIRGIPLADLNSAPNIETAVNPGFTSLDDAPHFYRGSLAGMSSITAIPRAFYEATDVGRYFVGTVTGWVELAAVPISAADLGAGAITADKLGPAPAARLGRPRGGAQTIPSNASTVLGWSTDSETYFEDISTMWDSANDDRLVVPMAGVYSVTAWVNWVTDQSLSSAFEAVLYWRDVSANVDRILVREHRVPGFSDVAGAGAGAQSLSAIVRADVNDYFYVKVQQWSPGNVARTVGSGHFAVARLGS